MLAAAESRNRIRPGRIVLLNEKFTVEAVSRQEVHLRVHGSVLLEDKPQFKLKPPPQDLKTW